MYIKEAKFDYFQNFKTGMGIDKIKFDFTTMKNPICVIIGPNGVGKTSLLSYLTPFATMGTLDVRESNRIIIPGKDGYKRIIFVDECMNEFEIEHFYLYQPSKDTFSIKSYIKMNGVELNENGNVSSFKELVYEYLNVDISFLKLIRIGKNVSNLIMAKSTERKATIGKILDDVDWYLKRFKYISQKERDLKLLIEHTIDEIKKTNIEDTEMANLTINKMDAVLVNIKEELENALSEKSTLDYKLETLSLPSCVERELSILEKNVSILGRSLKDAKDKGYTSSYISNIISKLEKDTTDLEHKMEMIEKDIEYSLKTIDNLITSIESLKSSIKKEEELLNLSSLESYLVDLKKKANEEYKQAFDEVPITCDKDEFEDFVVFLKNQQRTLNITYEYGKEPIKEVIKNMRKNRDIPALITSSLLAIEARTNAERLSIIDRLITKYAGIKVSCNEECPIKNLHKELLMIKDAEPVENSKFTAEFYQMMKLSYDNIQSVFNLIAERKDTIKKLPRDIQDMFTIDNICAKVSNCEIIYNEKAINELLSFLTERDNYRKLSDEIKRLEVEISEKKKASREPYLKKELEKTETKLSNEKDNLNSLKDSIIETEDNLSNIKKDYQSFILMKDSLLNYESEKNNYEDLQKRYKESLVITSQIKECENKIYELNESDKRVTKEKFKLQSNLENYKRLIDNLNVQKITYEDYSNLKFALSNKTGIPIIHITEYLKTTVKIANEIIDIAYNGDLRLGNFEINEDEFKMPYIKNGTVIEDVILASQGEESFFNLAISSALRSQSMSRFNIGLFDEVDSEFDDHNRQHFIPVLEKTLDLNNINQAFLISHNLMFRQYPVDIINMGDLDASTITIEYE